MTVFSEDGFGIIATKLGSPLMLDSYTFDMCMQSWRGSSYARAMFELRADEGLKDTIMVAMPKLAGKGFNLCTIHVEYEWKPLRPISIKNGANTSGKKKQAKVSREIISNSNPFDALNSVEDDADLGTNRMNSKSAEKGSLNVAHGSSSNTPIIDNIDKLERQIIDGELIEVEVVFDETKNLMASKSFKGGSDRAYGTNSMLEQLRETKRDDDYDLYDDDLYESMICLITFRLFVMI
ncbi:hypothetical protein Tco_0478533 [Tanacetum coccineum]